MPDRSEDCVLVVDDDAEIRDTLVEVLHAFGYDAEGVCDGALALDWLRGNAARTRVILLDLMMPGVNGIEFRRAQLQDPALANIPVIVLTGAPSVSRDAVLAGLEILVKPVDLRALIDRVARFASPPQG